jgi:hypothetical protein
MSISLTEKQIFCNTKPGFSFIFCNVAKKSFQKTSRLCEYDRFFAKSYSFVSFCVLVLRTILHFREGQFVKTPHFTAFSGVLPLAKIRTAHTNLAFPALHSPKKYGTVGLKDIDNFFFYKVTDTEAAENGTGYEADPTLYLGF